MEAFTDLHIHSCLSPCGGDDMTPWNIVGMARLKGLDVIALTDHNSALNAGVAMAAGRELGIIVIPGMEVTSREEVHVLAYFPSLENALVFGGVIDVHLPDIKNEPDLFGRQLIVGEDDEPIGEAEKLLINATDLSIDDICALAREHHGIALPAHINRTSNGMIGALGLMPMLPQYPVVEVSRAMDCPAYATRGRFVLHSSDAHRLGDMQEREFSLDVGEVSIQGVLERLRKEAAARG